MSDLAIGGRVRERGKKAIRLLRLPGCDKISNLDQPRGALNKCGAGNALRISERGGEHDWPQSFLNLCRWVVRPVVFDLKHIKKETKVRKLAHRVTDHLGGDLLVDGAWYVAPGENKLISGDGDHFGDVHKFREPNPGH